MSGAAHVCVGPQQLIELELDAFQHLITTNTTVICINNNWQMPNTNQLTGTVGNYMLGWV